MVYGKSKHHFSLILRFNHQLNDVNTTWSNPEIWTSKKGQYSQSSPDRINYPSSTAKNNAPFGYYANNSSYNPDSLIGNATFQTGNFTSKFIVGDNTDIYNKDKLRIITSIRVTCHSNVLSDLQKPHETKHSSDLESVPTFKNNKYGFVGFNI